MFISISFILYVNGCITAYRSFILYINGCITAYRQLLFANARTENENLVHAKKICYTNNKKTIQLLWKILQERRNESSWKFLKKIYLMGTSSIFSPNPDFYRLYNPKKLDDVLEVLVLKG